MSTSRGATPTLIVLGGYPGTGKTTLARRLSSELGIPRFGSDTIGQIIERLEGIKNASANAYWIAYDLLFGLAEDFLQTGLSVTIDTNMGWAFQWRRLDVLKERHRDVSIVPIVLRCARETCLERIQQRHIAEPDDYAPADRFTTDQAILDVWGFLDRLDRPDVCFVDAGDSQGGVYAAIKECLSMPMSGS